MSVVMMYGSSRGGYTRSIDTAVGFAGLIGSGIGIYLSYRICAFIHNRYWEPFTRRSATSHYRNLWQPQLFRLLDQSQVSYETLRTFVHSVRFKTTTSEWIKHFVDRDYALAMFAIAQRFAL